MSEAVHEVGHQATHEAAHSGKGKGIGLLIAILALCLAVAEMQGKAAQTHGLALNIEASDLWNFYQAKTIRQTVLQAALDGSRLGQTSDSPEVQKQRSAWQAEIERLETDPIKKEGRRELMEKAKKTGEIRDVYLTKYHAFEMISLVFQLAIVLASVALLSSFIGFVYASGILGAAGLVFLAGTYLEWPLIMSLLQ